VRRAIGAALATAIALTLPAAATTPGDTTPIELYVETFGSGPPLIALHGFGGNIYTWHAIRDELSSSHTVYAFDLKGFGKSPKPRDCKYSVYDQSRLILDFIAKNHLKDLTLVGHSFGGGVALATAVELEEKQPGLLSKLVLIDAASYKQNLPWYIASLRVPIIGLLGQHLLTSRKQVKIALDDAYFDKRRITKEQIEAYVAPLLQPGGKYALRETAKQIVPKDMEEFSKRYAHIRVPTLILWGRADRVVPLVNGERLAQAIPKSTLMVFDQVGHIPHEEMPDVVHKPLLDFLR
jgi:pimeloyl-ACP methyl ester carboxylesterase